MQPSELWEVIAKIAPPGRWSPDEIAAASRQAAIEARALPANPADTPAQRKRRMLRAGLARRDEILKATHGQA